MKQGKWLLVVMAAASLAGCGRGDKDFRTEISMKEVMGDVVDPAAQAFWKRSGEDDTPQGVVQRSPKPEDEEGWIAIENGGTQLAEAANLLLLPGRRRDNGDWVKHAHELHDLGVKINEAGLERNADKVFTIGADVYQVCTNCHQKYLLPYLDPKTGEPIKGGPLDPATHKK